MSSRGRRFIALAAALVVALLALPAGAQRRPFDAPRLDAAAHVPPQPPEYHVEEHGWARFAYHPTARERIRALIAHSGDVRAELVAILGEGVLQSVEIRIAALPGEMARLAPVELPSSASTVSFVDAHLIVMSLGSPLSLEPPDLDEGFRHALAHLALDDALDRKPIPRWFHEGFAVWFSGEAASTRAQALALGAFRKRLFPLSDLEDLLPDDAPPSSLAHAEAADALRFLLDQSKTSSHLDRSLDALRPEHAAQNRFADLVRHARDGESFEQALTESYASNLHQLDGAWRKDVARRYGFVPVLLGSSALWIVIAGAVAIRRLRRRPARRPLLVRHARTTGDEPRSPRGPPLAAPVRMIAARRRELEKAGGSEPPSDADVPKVEHGGRWYTLH